MKLWYQSMASEKAWPEYKAVLAAILEEVKEPGTTIEVHGIKKLGGVAEQFRYLEYLETAELTENVQTAARQGFDAFLIGNIADPGIRECRELVDIPVLGLCETSMHLACMMGASFALVGINQKFSLRVIENVRRAALTDRMAAVRNMEMSRLLTLEETFRTPAARDKVIEQFHAAASEVADLGAEVIIPAGGVVMALLAQAHIYESARNTPVLNGITALVKMGEMAVRLSRIMGGKFISKRLLYAAPGADQLDEIRKYYGDVFR